MPLFEIGEGATGNEIATTVGHFQRQALMTIEQHPSVCGDARETLQIGNDHHRKLQTLRLMNRHQANRIGSLIDLPLTLTTANRFKLFHVTHEVAKDRKSVV